MLVFNEQTQRYDLVLADGDKGALCQVKWCTRRRSLARSGENGKFYPVRVCNTCRDRRWRANNPEKHLFENLKKSAGKRHIEFTITIEDFIAAIDNTEYRSRKGRGRFHLHIDRKKNSLGYVPGNIHVMVAWENCSKGTRDLDDDSNPTDPF